MSEVIDSTNSRTTTRVGFGPRLGAYLIDAVFVSILSAIVGSFAGAAIGSIMGGSAMAGEGADAAAMGGALGGLLGGMAGMLAGIFLFYLIILVMEALTGASPGKMMLGLKIGSADGTNASGGTLWTRALLKYISYVLNVLAGVTGIGILAMLGSLGGLIIFIGCFVVLGEKRQAIHDMIAKTAVYRKNDLK